MLALQACTVGRSLFNPLHPDSALLGCVLTSAITRVLPSSCITSVPCALQRSMAFGSTPSLLDFLHHPLRSHTFDLRRVTAADDRTRMLL